MKTNYTINCTWAELNFFLLQWNDDTIHTLTTKTNALLVSKSFHGLMFYTGQDLCCGNWLALIFQELNLCIKSLIARSFRCSVAVNRKICHHTSLLLCKQLIGTCWQQGWISLLSSWVTVDQEKLSTPNMLSVIWEQQLVHRTLHWQVGKQSYYNSMLLHCVRVLSRDKNVNCRRNRNSSGNFKWGRTFSWQTLLLSSAW